MITYADQVFAPLDHDLELERIAGGNETEVYRTDDQHYVVKLKSELGGTLQVALARAKADRAAAERFVACLGPQHTIPSYYVVARDNTGKAQVLVIQPYLEGARQLFDIDYQALNQHERSGIATQLREIIRRSLSFYRTTASMPDLYGRTSASAAERARMNKPWMLPRRLWSFLVQRNLLRAHNLLLTPAPGYRIVLVDYDIVRRGWLYRLIYFAVRWILFWRDHALILLMRSGGRVPGRGGR
ncbi:MAG TPA: hypothetical protein VFU22_23055 [Roseiflexaceae bacterium]|nr:hypothetical protein [Roseiflexaceae bacterium]